MAAPDPESELLIRQLHRELNGLTRSRRTRPEPGELGRKSKLGQTRERDTPSTSEDHPSGSRDNDSKSAGHSEDAGALGKRPKGPAHSQDDGRPRKHARGSSPVRHKARAGDKDGRTDHEHDAPAVPKTPLEEAAAAASSLCKARAKRGQQQTGPRVIKCFHAGVRWGIPLSPDALRTRSDLATALNDAFAGEILSCGRGDILTVVFLGLDGRVAEFPPLRGLIGSARDNTTKWKAAVESAVKIYVMRS